MMTNSHDIKTVNCTCFHACRSCNLLVAESFVIWSDAVYTARKHPCGAQHSQPAREHRAVPVATHKVQSDHHRECCNARASRLKINSVANSGGPTKGSLVVCAMKGSLDECVLLVCMNA
eukprot:6192002-Pleurochrysis_carterae.AAC.4